jgi:hypothetical protein
MKQIDERTATLPQLIEPDRPRRLRPWPVTVLGLLLVGQAVGLFIVALLNLVGPIFTWAMLVEAVSTNDLNALIGLLLVCLACFAALSGFGFWRMWGHAWLHAMLLQGLCLLFALILYFWQKPGFVYLMMVYAIFMVLYLNYYEVRAAFNNRPADETEAAL